MKRTEEQIRLDFLEGKITQPNAINWETILNDQVIKSVEVDLTVTYTPEQGPHCELVLLIFAPQSRITLLAEGINRLVKEQMPNTSLELDHTGEYVMFIRDGSDGELQFVMGHADLQDTISVYGSEEYANEIPYLIKVVGNIVSMEVEEFFNEMKFVERAASLTIDSIYKAHGHKPVDARLELSLDSINRL